MELRDYIERGEKALGTGKELALALGVKPQHLSNAKAGARGLPDIASAKLAQLIGVPEIAVIAASEMVTAKDEKAREFWRPFAQNLSRAAGVFMTLSGLVMFSAAPKDANAAPVLEPVTMKVTESARNALPFSKTRPNDLYYVKYDARFEKWGGALESPPLFLLADGRTQIAHGDARSCVAANGFLQSQTSFNIDQQRSSHIGVDLVLALLLKQEQHYCHVFRLICLQRATLVIA